jgi:homocysteine S-methyltransferase
MLYAQGVEFGQCLEQLVIDRPERITNIHQAYAGAGSDLLTTHTFGANRFRLAYYGLESRVRELNIEAIRLARAVCEASGRDIFIAGNVGPVGRRVGWHDPQEQVAVADAFREQIMVFAEAGVDLLLFETFSDLVELEVAVRVAKEVCELPVVASMSYGDDGLTLAGQDARMVTNRLLVVSVDVIGANCSVGPAQMAETLRVMQEAAPTGLFSAMPNAGLPARIGEQLQYPVGPEDFAAHVPLFLNFGARLIGGCCGTTPLHIAAMRQALDERLSILEGQVAFARRR